MAYPILAAQNTWWAPNDTTIKRSIITEIEIMDSYTPDSSVTVVDSWDASAAKDGSITCYVIGTKLIIAGNATGYIYANENSNKAFATFTGMTTFNGLHLLKTDNVINMSEMFTTCIKLTAITGLSEWNVGNVNDMSKMFFMCQVINTLNDLSAWNTSYVKSFKQMFQGCQKLTTVGDLSNWNTSNAETFFYMFINCDSLLSLGNIGNWNVSKVTNMEQMFCGCDVLHNIGDLSMWNVEKVETMLAMFKNCTNLSSIGACSNWNMKNATDLHCMFEGCVKISGIDTSKWNPSSCTNMSFMFYSCSSLGEIDVSNWDVSKVTNFDHFASHANLKRKGIENWKTTSATNMNALFHNCAEEELDLSGFDVSKNQFFCQMFENSPNLKRVKGLNKWNTSSGLGFDEMFGRCSKLEEVDLSSFNTTKAKNNIKASTNNHKTATLKDMFVSCNNLKKVIIGPNFSINGDGTNTTASYKLILPTPSTDYIEGADGMWYTFNGESYAPNAVKDRTAETYFASYDIVANSDVIVKNSVLLNTASAIREKNGTTNKYTPSQFSDAILAL